jgi:thymidylate synthase
VIRNFSDDGRRFFGAYGPPFVEQLSYVVQALAADPASRQAVMTLWRPQPRHTKDTPCTVALQWVLRRSAAYPEVDGVGPVDTPLRLHCVATMRSSDAWTGWPYDVHTFSVLSAVIALELKLYATSLAKNSLTTGETERAAQLAAVELGDLYLTAGSQHLYVADREPAERSLAAGAPDGGTAYAPLDLAQFPDPEALVDHLWRLARGEVSVPGRTWLTELVARRT